MSVALATAHYPTNQAMIGILKGLAITISSHFRKPVTVQYPDERMVLPSRSRGFPGLVWDEEVSDAKCVACLLCARNCPASAIEMTAGMRPPVVEAEAMDLPRAIKESRFAAIFEINVARCICCGTCTQVCPFHAIVMTHTCELAAYSHEEMVMNKEALLRMSRDQWGIP